MRSPWLAVRAGDATVAAVALGAAWALKAFYSAATFDQLRWLLAPTVSLVRAVTGVPFELEPHLGYLSHDPPFLVAPVCAGVNFLVVAFVSLCLGMAPGCSGVHSRVALVLGSAPAAYAATVVANATRIALAVRLHDAGAVPGPLSPAQLHCALGVAVYFPFLLALFALATRAAGVRHAPAR
jgi:exosortase K